MLVMNTKRLAILAAVVVCAGAALVVPGSPATAASSSGGWQLNLTFHDPQRVTLNLPGRAEPVTYWYLLFQVTNESGQDVDFYPSFDLVTDTLQVVTGGVDVNPRVYDVIKARHKQEFPFFAPPWELTGPLLQGKDNARASAVVFREFDPQADGFSVFVSGLSNKVERVKNPGYDKSQPESDDNARFFILRETLKVQYELPGDPDSRREAKPVRRNRTWVMR